jgi:acetylornithine deacetylase
MTDRKSRITQAVDALAPRAESLLLDLIAIPSLSGKEERAVRRAARAFRRKGWEVELQPLDSTIKLDPDYSFPEANLDYSNRHNLLVRIPGSGEGKSALLQTHLDIVPSGDWDNAFKPSSVDGVVTGRGACDCKGQAATLWLAVAALSVCGIALQGDVLAQLVVEEEIGGNGALAAILTGDRADAAVILEPTSLQIHPACRGACWFRYVVTGRPVHMGRRHEGVNAFEKAMKLCQALLDYEVRLIDESRSQPLFERYENPVQVNIGVVRAGEWPSMAPGTCVVEGGVGFLPNRTMRSVQEDLLRLIPGAGDPWLIDNTVLDFPKLHNDAYRIDPAHPAVIALESACRSAGLASEVFGWNVSCDARLYALRAGIPAIVFGPGDIADAHSDHERIALSDIKSASVALALWLVEWWGAEEQSVYNHCCCQDTNRRVAREARS